jgi:hypothetical protein
MMEPFANDLREIDHFPGSLEFFIVFSISLELAVSKRSEAAIDAGKVIRHLKAFAFARKSSEHTIAPLKVNFEDLQK